MRKETTLLCSIRHMTKEMGVLDATIQPIVKKYPNTTSKPIEIRQLVIQDRETLKNKRVAMAKLSLNDGNHSCG